MSRDANKEEYLGQLYDVVMAGGSDDTSILTDLQRIATASPENAMAQLMLSSVQARLGQTDDAVATLRQAITRGAGGQRAAADLRKGLGQTLTDATRYAEAVSVYDDLLKDLAGEGAAPLTSVETKEEAADILTSIIKLQIQSGRVSDALSTIERTRQLLGSEDPTADVQYVELLREQSKRPEALKVAREALIKYPEQRLLLWYQAATLTDLGRVDEGVALLRERLKNSPEDAYSFMQISSLYSQAGRGAEAVEAARKAVDQTAAANPKLQTRALLSLSSAQEKAGDPKGSEDSLRQILSREPQQR
ncbi:MAG: tetratricopeptide repeat protein [Pyrinomonadaceae bacterium]